MLKKYLYLILVLVISGTDSWSQEQIALDVRGKCGMCTDRIETTSKKVEGIIKAEYNLDNQKLIIDFSPSFLKENLVAALLNAGHDSDGKKAPDVVGTTTSGIANSGGAGGAGDGGRRQAGAAVDSEGPAVAGGGGDRGGGAA